MKICHMTSAHDSDDIRILKKQCVSLAKDKNNEVFLVAKGDSYEYKNVNIVGIGKFEGNRIQRILKGSKAVFNKAVEINADIYELHDPELLLYVKKLKRKGKKVIFDSHENYQQQILEKGYIPKALRKLVRFCYSLIENRACKYLDAALFPSEENPFLGRVKNCVAIYNTPILDEFNPTTPFNDKEDKACCVGSLTESRGLTTLIEACYKADVPLILGGIFSPESYGEELKKKREYSIVEYKGYCNRQMVREIYDRCLIGTDTILNVGQYGSAETLSTKVYEYMAMGIPYITSDFKYNKKIIDEYNCGIYVNPSDPDEIAEAMRYLISNRATAKKMGENGKNLVESKFNWKDDENRLYELYKKLCSM